MEEPRYWFPAKRYGWGWGFPCAWQGWAVLAGYFVLLAAGMWLIPPHAHALYFSLYLAVISCLLLWVCKLKGEPPSWRWGR